MSSTTPTKGPLTEADLAYRKVAWRLIPFLMLCYFCAHIDRSNIGIAKLQLSQSVGLTEAMYGFGAGIFYLGYLIVEVPSNLLLAKFGARVTIARILVIWSLTSASFALITQAWQFYGLRFILGIAEAGFFPGVIYYLAHWAPAVRRARFTAMFMSSLALSGVISGPLSGSIMQNMNGVAGLAGWQWMFMLEGLPGVALGVIGWFYLTERPAEARWLTPAERDLIQKDLEAEAELKKGQPYVQHSFLATLKDWRFYCLSWMASAQMSTVAGVALWMPTMLKSAGVKNVGTVGLLAAIPYICAVIVQQLIARSSDKRQERRWHSAAPSLLSAGAWLALPFAGGDLTLTMALLILATVGVLGGTGPFWTLPSIFLSKSASAGGIAVMTTFGGLGAFVSPIVVGWAASLTGSLATGQIYYGMFMLIGAGLTLIAARTTPAKVAGPRSDPAAAE